MKPLKDLAIKLTSADLARLNGMKQKQMLSGLKVKQGGNKKEIREAMNNLDDYKYFKISILKTILLILLLLF